ncbi:MAG: hypothetical protein AB7N76_18525 [Planctomycetota bacterium]
MTRPTLRPGAPSPLRLQVAASLAALLLVLVGAPLAFADDDDLEQRMAAEAAGLPVRVEAKVGLATKTPRRGFIPVQVDLTAREAPRAVRVRVRPLDNETPLLELEPVSLEPGAARRVRGLAPARLLNDCPAVLIEALAVDDGSRVGVALAYPDPSYDRVLLVADRRGAPPCDLSKLRSRQQLKVGTREDAWLSATLGRPDELPDSPLAYTGVNAVLLGDMSFERWSGPQASALAGWVARGGHLILSLGADAAGLRGSLLGRALGAGLDPLPSEQPTVPGDQVSLRGALSHFGDPGELSSARPPTLARLLPGPGDEVVLRDDARPPRPFVLTRRHGAGRITFVGADLWAPPFLHAAHTRRLLEELLDASVRYEPRSRWLFPKLAEIRQPTQIGPAFALLIVFALVAGPGVYFLLRAKKRGALLWIAIPALTLAFSLLVPLYRLALRKAESTLVGVRLIEARAGEALGVETLDVLLFSGSLQSKRLELKGDDAVAYAVVPPRRFRGRGGEPSLGAALGSADSAGRLRFELPVALWGARYVSCERTAKLRAPTTGSIGVRSAPDLSVQVRIHYEGYMKLLDPVLVIPVLDSVQLHQLPHDLAPGADYAADGVELKGVYDPDHEGLAAIVGEGLVTGPLAREALRDKVAYLVGHTEQPSPLTTAADANVRVRAFATLVAIELPLRFLDHLPFGAAQPYLESSTVAQVGSQSLDREHVTRFQLPPEARGHAVRKLELRLSAARWATLRDASLEALDQRSQPPSWRPLDLRPARRIENTVRLDLDVPDPASWVGPAGEIRLRERFRRPVRANDADFTVTIELAADWGPPPAPDRD